MFVYFKNTLIAVLMLMLIGCSGESDSSDTSETQNSGGNGATEVSIAGSVFDAAMAHATVTLMELGNDQPLLDPVVTDVNGDFTLAGIDLSQRDSSSVLYLQIGGKGDGKGCNNTSSSQTFVDINDNGSFDATTDRCLGENVDMKSYLGTVAILDELEEESSGNIDSAQLPDLNVTHITTAKSALVDNILSDSTTDSAQKASYLVDLIDTMISSDENVKKQVAKLATIIRASNHDEISGSSNLGTLIKNKGLSTVVNDIVKGDATLDTNDEQIINNSLANDQSGYVVAELAVDASADLTGVTFENPELKNNLNNFQDIQTLSAQYLSLLNSQADLYEGKTNFTPSEKSAYLVYGNNILNHTSYLHNGRSSDQHLERMLDEIEKNPIKESIYIDVRLSRMRDATGDLYFDASTDSLTHSSNQNFPVYRVLGKNIIKYVNNTFVDRPLDGYVIIDGQENVKQIGNLEKFNARLAAYNRAGEKRIILFVSDPNKESKGGRFTISSVWVEVIGDTSLSDLSGSDLHYRGHTADSPRVWKNDCTKQTNQDKNSVCLNIFPLELDYDADKDQARWEHRFFPGTDRRLSVYRIPQIWTPKEGSIYKITIDFVDSLTNQAGQQETLLKMKSFPNNDYLAKLLDGDGNYLTQSVVGNGNQIDLSWTYKAKQNDVRIYYPSGSIQKVLLYDPINETNLNGIGIDTDLGGKTRKVALTGDFSNVKILDASIFLSLPDGSSLSSVFQLQKRDSGDWVASQFKNLHLESFFSINEDHIGGFSVGAFRLVWPNVASNGPISSIIEFDENDFTLDALGNDPISRELIYNPWDFSWSLDEENMELVPTSSTKSINPSIKLSYTPTYSGKKTTVEAIRLYPNPVNDDYARSLTVSYTSSDLLNLTWQPPVNSSTLRNKNNGEAYEVRIRVRPDSNSSWDEIEREKTNNLSYTLNEALPVGTTQVRAEIQAFHNGFHYQTRVSLRCTTSQITGGSCIADQYKTLATNGDQLIVDAADDLRTFDENGDSRLFYFNATEGQAYKIKVKPDTTTDTWDQRALSFVQVFDEDWVPIERGHNDPNLIWQFVPEVPKSGTYRLIVGDNLENPAFEAIRLGVFSESYEEILENSVLQGTIEAEEMQVLYFSKMAGVDYQLKFSAHDTLCSPGADFTLLKVAPQGHWDELASLGFHSEYPVEYFLPAPVTAEKNELKLLPTDPLSNTESCQFTVNFNTSDENGVDVLEAIQVNEASNTMGQLNLNQKRYYQYTATFSGSLKFIVGSNGVVALTPFTNPNDISGSVLPDLIDIDSNSLDSCSTSQVDNWDSMECNASVTASTTYYFELELSNGKNGQFYNFRVE